MNIQNNEKNKNYYPVIVFIILSCLLFFFYQKGFFSEKTDNKSNEIKISNTETIITDKDYLYDKCVEYIKSKYHDLNTRKAEKDYQVIVSYEPFGITNDGNYDYAYMWVLSESYFVKHDILYNGRSNSSLYKFYFKDDEIVDYYMPINGKDSEKAESYIMDKTRIQFKSSENQESDFNIELKKNCLNKDIYSKIVNYTVDLSNESIVKNYYSYLKDLTIYHEVLEKDNDEDDDIDRNCKSNGGMNDWC